jgi:hypothetical protein
MGHWVTYCVVDFDAVVLDGAEEVDELEMVSGGLRGWSEGGTYDFVLGPGTDAAFGFGFGSFAVGHCRCGWLKKGLLKECLVEEGRFVRKPQRSRRQLKRSEGEEEERKAFGHQRGLYAAHKARSGDLMVKLNERKRCSVR